MGGFICSSSAYEYKGVSFEIHSYCGPWPLKKNGDPRRYAPAKFWDLWEEFSALPLAEQEKYCTYQGGCKTF